MTGDNHKYRRVASFRNVTEEFSVFLAKILESASR